MKESGDDIELVQGVRDGSHTAFAELAILYRPMLKSEASSRAGRVAYDDLYQEALIALHAAALSFDLSRGVAFGAYARICVSRRLTSAIRRDGGPDHLELDCDIESPGATPEQFVLAREQHRGFLRFIDSALTEYEREVFRLYLDGHSYIDIAARLGKTRKSVDGAIRRSKEKLREAFSPA